MKNYELTISVLSALLLVNTSAIAEDKYPASDFQPKVVYQDDSVSKQAESSSSNSAKPASTSSADSQYPAANFEPKVLYSDENYKHNSAVPTNSYDSTQTSGSVSAGNTGSAVATAAPKEESSVGYLLGLIVFGIAGFILYKRGAGSTVASKAVAPSVSKNLGGTTGVGRYLMKISGTGVSRYLDKQAKEAPVAKQNVTGVAKYLASQTTSAKSTTTEAVTGVEKYMRKKG